MKLRVLAGAKKGTEIPLKKSKFVIGRASDCTLRAGSEAISRRHCVILLKDGAAAIRDLGSRNGTHVNGEAVTDERLLVNGDTVRVGPLEFVFHGAVDIAHEKKPKVKSVAEAVDRAARAGDSVAVEEDDISSWLLGPSPSEILRGKEAAMRETTTFKMDDTRAAAETGNADGGEETPVDEGAATITPEDVETGKPEKPKPGKLPKLPPKPLAKDSREAAADILRELSRRR
ncbi:MAG: FHA domain-containing protein [Planctomycetota bacterium]